MSKIFVIAEAGVNHNGDCQIALEMVAVAAQAGADAIKFQTFNTDVLAKKHTPKAGYQVDEQTAGESQFDMLRKLELSKEAFIEIKTECDRQSIEFMSTAFDIESLDFLVDELDMQRIKIPSGEITNPFLLEHAALKKRPLILSTGMAEMDEIQMAVECVRTLDANSKLTILHCRSAYPTNPSDMALGMVRSLAEHFKVPVGLSDHSLGIHVPLVAAGLGISMLEKHFTLDRSLDGPDHQASLEPDELSLMISQLRQATLALQFSEKTLLPEELENRSVARRGMYAARDIEVGHIFERADFIALRPENGTSPFALGRLIGTPSRTKYGPFDDIRE